MNEPRPGMPATAHPQAHGMPPRFTPHPPPQRNPQNHTGPVRPAVVPGTAPPSEKELEPISLIEEEAPAAHHTPAPGAPPPSKKILAFGADHAHKEHAWKRQPFKPGTGAIRVKSFHGKYSEQGIEYLDNAVNEWIDAHPEVEVKFVTPTVMTFEGKIREPALVLNVWY